MDFADELTKVETDAKRQKLEGGPYPTHVVMNPCEQFDEQEEAKLEAPENHQAVYEA